VSPLWRDEVGAYLSPHRLCLVRLGRGLRPVLAAEHEEHLAAEAAGWDDALASLDARLREEAWGGANVRVVVCNHWVRYAIVPWSAALASGSERLAFARQLLAASFGDAVADWTVCLAEAPPGCPRIACALPPALLESVHSACAKPGVRLASIHPQLISAYNSRRHLLPTAGAWFVTLEEGLLAAARVGRAGWDRVHAVRIGADWTRELRRLATFGRLASSSAEEGQVYVDAPQAWRESAGEAARTLNWLAEDDAPLTTMQRLQHVRRRAA